MPWPRPSARWPACIPDATFTIPAPLRHRGPAPRPDGRVDYLALADATRLLDPSQGRKVISDERISQLAGKEREAANQVRQVRAAEAVDPKGRQWPRTKRSDDATAVYVVLS
jgi:hypothetical protein